MHELADLGPSTQATRSSGSTPIRALWQAAPSGTERQLAGFLTVLDMDWRDACHHPDAMARLRRGDLQAIVISNVYDSDTLAMLVARLEAHDPPFLRSRFPAPFQAGFYGRNLNLTGDKIGRAHV